MAQTSWMQTNLHAPSALKRLGCKQISDFWNIVIVEFTGVDIRGLPWQELFLSKKL